MLRFGIWFVATGAIAGCTELPVPRPDAIIDVPAMETGAPVTIRTPVIDIPPSRPAGEYVLGWYCSQWPDTFRYQHIRTEAARSRLEPVVAGALREAGIGITNDPEILFPDNRPDDPDASFLATAGETEGAASAAARRFEIGARVTDIDLDACPQVDPWSGAPGGNAGTLVIQVDWQVWDHHQDRLALRRTHSGGASLDLPDEMSVPLLLETAFSVSASRFLADPQTRALLAAP